MRKNKGFTLIELLVVIAIIALLISIVIPALKKAKEQAQFIICQNNLRSYGIIGVMYTAENDGEMPYPWTSIYSEFQYPGEIRYCRWHNPDYDLSQYPEYAGPLWPYLEMKNANLCPKFKTISKKFGHKHWANHDPTIPIVPQFSFSMNGFLGIDPTDNPRDFYIDKISKVSRPSEVFFFAEENMWPNDWAPNVLNDNALISDWNNNSPEPPFLDAFATFHKAKDVDMNLGVSDAVFADGHVQIVEAKDTHKYAWPY